MAAVLAEKGFTSSEDIIAGPNGFGSVMSDKFDPTPLTSGLGDSWAVDEIIIKRHASCYRTHAVIECGLALRESVLSHVDQIAFVKCLIPPLAWDMAHILDPQNGLEAKFSQPFCTAVALVEGLATNQVFSLGKIKNPLIAGLIKKTTVEVDPALETTEAKVEIALKSGRSFCQQKDTEKLGLTPQQIKSALEVKFTSLLKGHAPDGDIQALIKSVLELESAENIDLMIAELPRMNR
jgi:2-methylcitrate dehydratase PrpD